MTSIHYVTEKEMVRRTGLAALGYSQPDKKRILIQKGLPKKLQNLVKRHEFEHAKKGEEGPFLPALMGFLGSPAGGAMVGGALSGLGAASAGQAQAGSQAAATAEQRRQYDLNMQRQQPWQEAGVGALGKLRTLMGLDGDTGAAMEMVRGQPGYQFREEQGRRALERSQAAGGKQLSGQAMKEITRYGQGFAESEYGNMFNRLSNMAGLGQTANQQMGAYGQQMVGQMGRQGAAQAGGAMTAASGLSQAVQGTLGNLSFDRYLNQFGGGGGYQGTLGPSDSALEGDWTSDIGW